MIIVGYFDRSLIYCISPDDPSHSTRLIKCAGRTFLLVERFYWSNISTGRIFLLVEYFYWSNISSCTLGPLVWVVTVSKARSGNACQLPGKKGSEAISTAFGRLGSAWSQ
jgi:hypothetical protein